MPSVYTTSREHFEQRMRARRAATCLAVARSAIASGRIVEAIERLEEACSLDPDAGEARLLLEELRLQESPASGEEAGSRPSRGELAGWSHWLAAGFAIGALAGLAYLWPAARPVIGTGGLASPPQQHSPADRQPGPAATEDDGLPPGLAAHVAVPVATSGAGDAAPESGAPADEHRLSRPVAIELREQPVTETLPMRSASSETTAAPPAAAEPASGVNAGSPTVNAVASSSAPSPSGIGAVSTALPSPAQAPPLERVAVASEEPKAQPVEAANVPVSAAPAPPSSDAGDALMRTRAGETNAIEETLHRYADAYARLDARAARAVWPTVDQRALARAFESLESQGLVFESCDVTVAETEATAACRGRARYVPKVGSREPLVEQRRWTFRLRKANEGWQIVQAEAR